MCVSGLKKVCLEFTSVTVSVGNIQYLGKNDLIKQSGSPNSACSGWKDSEYMKAIQGGERVISR